MAKHFIRCCDLFNFFISVSCVTFYIVFCIYKAEAAVFHGDSLEYMHSFNEIQQYPFPYGIEFVTSSIMWAVSILGFGFREFVLICLLLWSPVIFLLGRIFKYKFLSLFVFLYFLTPFFIDNTFFLIRQYNAAFFFICYIVSSHRNKKSNFIPLVFLFLSFGSHISAILWFLMSNRLLLIFVRSRLSFVFFLFLVFLLINTSFFMPVFIDFLDFTNVLSMDEITRKLLFYTSGEFESAPQVSALALMASVVLLFVSGYIFFLKKACNQWVIFVFLQSLLVFALKDNVVMANRFGFFSFYFSIPILFWLFLVLNSCKGR